MIRLPSRWQTLAAALALSVAWGYTPPLLKDRTDVPAVHLSVVGQPAVSDGRARFREIYCGMLAFAPEGSAATCDVALARLSDERPQRDDPSPFPAPDLRLHILFITGAFGECFKDIASPFPAAIAHVSTLGW